jgi:hypothetical protein
MATSEDHKSRLEDCDFPFMCDLVGTPDGNEAQETILRSVLRASGAFDIRPDTAQRVDPNSQAQISNWEGHVRRPALIDRDAAKMTDSVVVRREKVLIQHLHNGIRYAVGERCMDGSDERIMILSEACPVCNPRKWEVMRARKRRGR